MRPVVIVQKAENAGGITIDPYTGVRPREGYAVAVKETVHERLTISRLSAWTSANRFSLLRPQHYLGLWRDGRGYWYYEVSRVCPKLSEALKLAKQHRQLSIYDLTAGEIIPVDQITVR